jgi:NADH dehydrogenase FAD-containing subunit
MSKVVVIGTGFAGVWSAISAQRVINQHNKNSQVQVVVISPEPTLVIRVRLYEANASSMIHPLGPLFESAGIHFVQGFAEKIDTDKQTVSVRSSTGLESIVAYDRLVLAAGSSVKRPSSVAGLEEHAFAVDSLAEATELEKHIKALRSVPESDARNTVVVCGAGFTGIEVATEMAGMLAHIGNHRIVLVDGAPNVGQELGPGPRPTIEKALRELGIETKLGAAVASLDAEGVVLTSGERIESKTVIWTAGVRASSLTAQVSPDFDALGRLNVDRDLRAPGCRNVFAAGDVARALADEANNQYTLMSCQHGIPLGKFAGHNAAMDLLGEPTTPYSQALYATNLDLGAWGSVLSVGWERKVQASGAVTKHMKRWINRELIYPPEDVDEALRQSDPLAGEETMLGLMFGVLSWTLSSWTTTTTTTTSRVEAENDARQGVAV